jgi:hypothetical protein
MTVFKTYNLKLDEKTYFKLREIETYLEKQKKKNFTKSEVIAEITSAFVM